MRLHIHTDRKLGRFDEAKVCTKCGRTVASPIKVEVWGRDGMTVIGGHHRLAAARALADEPPDDET